MRIERLAFLFWLNLGHFFCLNFRYFIYNIYLRNIKSFHIFAYLILRTFKKIQVYRASTVLNYAREFQVSLFQFAAFCVLVLSFVFAFCRPLTRSPLSALSSLSRQRRRQSLVLWARAWNSFGTGACCIASECTYIRTHPLSSLYVGLI